MKKMQIAIFALFVSFFGSGFVHAHDPSLHKEKMEKPKCEAMKNMDHSNIDANDPVMLAMMKKCKSVALTKDHHVEHTENKSSEVGVSSKVEQQNDAHNH